MIYFKITDHDGCCFNCISKLRSLVEENSDWFKYNEWITSNDDLIAVMQGDIRFLDYCSYFNCEISISNKKEDVVLMLQAIIDSKIDGHTQTHGWLANNGFIPVSETLFYKP